MGIIVKWAIGGAVLGALYWMFNYNDVEFMPTVVVGAGVAIAIRKWLFRMFWQ